MSTNRYIILFSILLFLPLCAKAQRFKSVTERQAEQIGKSHYVTTSNDTTLVVNFISTGLDSPETQFLKLDKSNATLDSLFHKKLDYTPEEALLDMNDLILNLQKEKKEIKGNNDGLSFRLASKNRDLRQKETEAKELANSVKKDQREELSVEELAALRVKYGDQPTYYINEVEVNPSFVNLLLPSDVIKKERRVKNTVSGNPNGEVWISVTEKGLNRIKLSEHYDIHSSNKNLGSYIEDVKKARREKEIHELKSLPVIKRETTNDGKQIDREVAPLNNRDETGNASYGKGTRVLKRTVTNPGSKNSTVTYESDGAPAQRSSIPVVKKKGQADKGTNNDAPKKSVRRIKEKQAEQYRDDTESGLE